jgi:hypothetical protein
LISIAITAVRPRAGDILIVTGRVTGPLRKQVAEGSNWEVRVFARKESVIEQGGPKGSVTAPGVTEPDWLLSEAADVDPAGRWVAQLDYHSIADVPFYVVAGVVFTAPGSPGDKEPLAPNAKRVWASTPAKLIRPSVGTTASGTAPRSP